MIGPFRYSALLVVLRCIASEENNQKYPQNGGYQNTAQNGAFQQTLQTGGINRNGGILQLAEEAKQAKKAKKSASPSAFPSLSPSSLPSRTPSASPSALPSASPSTLPSSSPTSSPSALPSASPSDEPSASPSASPSDAPSSYPSSSPTMFPTAAPTYKNPETCDICPAPKAVQDRTMREGLGESPGIPNLEYLGLGYNIFEGNPRGSDISEVDPGFRSGVIQLIQEQTTLTIDQEYMVPLGVDVRYITSCKFASRATEISSERDYQKEISREATQSSEARVGVGLPLFSVSADYAFSSSQKYKQFTETSEKTKTVTFEAKAMCSEFKASLQPFVSHLRTERFETALDSLPYPYDSRDSTHEDMYRNFFASFGTHYIRDVTLGAKHIFSSEINSRDVAELQRQEVEIESSLSWSVQAGFGGGGGGNENYGELVRSKISAGVGGGGDDDDDDRRRLTGVRSERRLNPAAAASAAGASASTTTYTYVFEDPSVGGGASSEETQSENTQTSSLEKTRSKVATVNELNVGGNPPEDGNWKTWATTVRDRPMPISYELDGVWNLIAEDAKKEAFYHAIIDIYNIDVRKRKDSKIVDALRFGVATGNGEPISSYNRDPNSNYRSSLQLTATPSTRIFSEKSGNIVTVGDPTLDVDDDDECEVKPFQRPPDDKKRYACGAAVNVDNSGINLEGITGMRFFFCELDEWDNERKTVVLEDTGEKKPDRYCDKDTFITEVTVQTDTCTSCDNEGVDKLEITCSRLDGSGENKKTVGQGPNASKSNKSSDSFANSDLSAGNNGNYLITGVSVRNCKENLGIIGLNLEFSDAVSERRYASYQYDISKAKTATVPATFATIVRGAVAQRRDEELTRYGFSASNEKAESYVLDTLSNYPFGLMEEGKAKIVIQDFKSESGRGDNLENFSFLSARNLPSEANYVAGVVHPDGYAVDENFGEDGTGYKIMMEDPRNYRIIFSDESMRFPTFITFPLWFPGPKNAQPSYVDDVAISNYGCIKDPSQLNSCYVKTGGFFSFAAGGTKGWTKNRLGFSFLALGQGLDLDKVSGIAHGVVTLKREGNDTIVDTESSWSNGFNYEAKFRTKYNDGTSVDIKGGEKNGRILKFNAATSCCEGGVEIIFEKKFKGLPAVIVSPIPRSFFMKFDTDTIDKVDMPYAVVETIEEDRVFVKSDFVQTFDGDWGGQGNVESNFTSISFHIVAVGPQRDEFLPETPSPSEAPSTIILD